MRYTSSLTPLLRGPRGTRTTLAAMERLVEGGIRDPEVVLFAQEQVRNGPEYGQMSDVETILASVRRHMRYTGDPVGVETVKSPTFAVKEIKEKGRAVMDCDDASVLAAALIRAVGVPTRFKVIRDNPAEYTHVYLEAMVDGRWVKVDPIARELRLGQAPEGRFGSAYFEGGRMYRGNGRLGATSIGDAFSEALAALKSIQDQKLELRRAESEARAAATRAKMEEADRLAAAGGGGEGIPWGKVALVAGVGIGAIVLIRALKKGR